MVAVRPLETLKVVAGSASARPGLREPLRRHVEKVWADAQAAGHSAPDMEVIEARYRDALAALKREHAGAPATPAKRKGLPK